jgi:glucose/arabinose dehydrogenase
MHFSYFFFLLIFLVGGKCESDHSVAVPPGISTRILTENLRYPWEILWGPDNMIWMTERDGKVSKVNPSTGKVVLLLKINGVVSRGEGGLLGMALHPQFQNHPLVFIAYDYVNPAGDYKEKVVRYEYDGNTLVKPTILLDNINAAGIHNGCRLLTTPDLKLFISTGDASDQTRPQNKNALNGKILRLNLDGSIPADNPFPNNPVWSYGHRNAQGLVLANNILYSSEHGPSSDDEINIIEKGRNYGWPNVEGLCNEPAEKTFCTANNVKEPIYTWTPTEAVCGLDYYDKNQIANWKNSLLLCTLKGSKLIQLRLSNDKKTITSGAEFLNGSYGRLRDICISPEGKVYICTSNGGDKIVEISGK